MVEVAFDMGLLLVWVFLNLILHELAHFGVAKYNRRPISRFVIGIGPLLFNSMWKGTRFKIHLIPLGGSVDVRFLSMSRIKNIALFAAGPIANILVGLAVLCFMEGETASMLYTAAFIMGAYNLIPTKYEDGTMTGGYRIRREFRVKRTNGFETN